MKTKKNIREYQSIDKEALKRYYTMMCKKKQTSRVFHALKRRKPAQLTWKAGLVMFVAIFLMQHHLLVFLLELIVWSMAVGYVWYRWITLEYVQYTAKACQAMVTQFDDIQTNKDVISCAWLMENTEGEIVGTVALKHHNGEGQVGYLTGQDARIRLMLVQKAIQFGRTNKIEVISKWGNDTNNHFTIKTLSRSIDHQPMHHLFSPTALDYDLTYVDKTQISLLTRLTLLDVSHNKMEQLPNTIDQLTQLRHLNISHNEITKLPTTISALSKLMVLNVSSNPIKRVSANIAQLTRLVVLDLSSTDIKAIPTELLVLSHTTIKTDNCPHLLERSVKIDCKLSHDPVSLLETCARHVLQPILFEKKKKKKKTAATQDMFSQLPQHLRHYLSKTKSCSSCGGPYIDSYVVRYRIVQRQDETWVPVEYRLCAAHWSNEDERILAMFSQGYPLSPFKKDAVSKLMQPDSYY
ncbi:L domain-like protein [Backusella circina FSU 941]|nr:L domain-like protein [Backusella circina FSU 941]